jgi:signal transduction histidine kinase
LPAFSQGVEVPNLRANLRAAKDSIQYVDILNRIGFFMHMKSADSCLHYGMASKLIADRIEYPKGQAEALSNIATALYLKSLYNQALSTYSDALATYESVPDYDGISNTYMNMAMVYDVLGETDNAKRFSVKSISSLENTKNDSLKSLLYANYASLRPRFATDSMNYYLEKAEKIAEKYQDDRTQLFVWQIRAERLFEQNRPEQALEMIRRSLKVARANQWDYHEIVGVQYIADYLVEKNEIDSAIACYELMYKKADENKFSTFKREILNQQLHAYSLKNDGVNVARINQLLIATLEEELESSQQFAVDYVTYNNRLKTIERLQMEKKNDGQKILMLIAVTMLVLFAGIYIIFLYRRLLRSSSAINEMNRRISEQNESLRKEDEFKTSLVSMIAHDFRSPLNSTLSMVGMLKDNEFERENLAMFYKSIETDVRTTLLIFDNMLNWIKIQYSGYMYQPYKLRIRALIDEVVQMHRGLACDRQVKIVNRIPDDAWIETDKEIIQFINRNLINNALKFSPEHGTITINMEPLEDETIISITDEGDGMSAAQISALFQVGRGTVTQKSAGIALKICRELLERLNGRIWSESSPGNGTTFFYAIPRNASEHVLN